MQKAFDERFDRLEALIERGFAAVGEDTAEITEQVVRLQSDLQQTKSDTREIRSELKDIHNRLEELDVLMRNTSGFAKEIDYILQRVSEIEKHLGIEQKISA